MPSLPYERHLLYERNLRNVTGNTRADGEAFLRLAAAIPLEPQTARFHLSDANRALRLLRHDGIQETGVLEIAAP